MSERPIVAIFAGSSTPKDPAIMEAATLLGKKLGEAGFDLVYGAGTGGVMGAVAKAAQAAGAHVTAVVLHQYRDEEQLPGATVINVMTEQERFHILSTHRSPLAYFALPGGPGSLRETLQQLEKGVYEGNTAPVVLVQVGQYLDGIKQYFDAAIAAGLIKPDKKDRLKLWPATGDLADVVPGLRPDDGIPGLYRGLGR
ncbi:MAG: hypothetical protein EPN97_05700 [Alphaproteobacteria bacterium]|nr:MAG: hypothetical protein EPN97_05700 [Alphaproteobacteria bacterium]